jgi:hypothetical protein
MARAATMAAAALFIFMAAQAHAQSQWSSGQFGGELARQAEERWQIQRGIERHESDRQLYDSWRSPPVPRDDFRSFPSRSHEYEPVIGTPTWDTNDWRTPLR